MPLMGALLLKTLMFQEIQYRNDPLLAARLRPSTRRRCACDRQVLILGSKILLAHTELVPVSAVEASVVVRNFE